MEEATIEQGYELLCEIDEGIFEPLVHLYSSNSDLCLHHPSVFLVTPSCLLRCLITALLVSRSDCKASMLP